jgi:hypothetical protein
MRCIIGLHVFSREGMRFSRYLVCLPVAAFLLLIGAAAALPTQTAQAAADAGGARMALAADAASSSAPVAARSAQSPTTRRRAALRRLQVAARKLHWTVDKVVQVPNDADFLAVTQAQFDRAELILAIRNARAAGLSEVADRYQRVLDAETKRLNRSTAFSDLLRQASQYGEHIAQKAHDADPSLPAAVLGNIAVNAANWYGNDALLKVTLRAAKQKSAHVFEITVKKEVDLDRQAYALYRSLSVGARRTGRPYGGKEGLHALPDANGGFNGGLIGFRRVAETSDRKSPAIDINLNGRLIKIHVRHEP